VRDANRRPPPEPQPAARKIQLEVRQADVLTFAGDALLLPTVSEGRMVEPLAARIKQAAGKAVEEDAMRSAPIAVGAAVVTAAGALPLRALIHAPLTEHPGMKVSVENIRRATRAGLFAAAHYQLDAIAIPGIGTGDGGVPHDEAARAIIDEVRAFRGAHPSTVVLIDPDFEMVDAFHIELGPKE
jgi:O-acetyl-ADP-ribose deacetylase (regulator of RNase III)